MKKFYFGAFLAVLALFCMQLVSCNPSGGNIPSTSTSELWPAKANNGNWGFIDRKGNFVVSANYQDVYPFSCGYAVVLINGTYMFINEEGILQKSPYFDRTEGFYNNYAVARMDGKYGVLDRNFNWVIQPIYTQLGGEYWAVAANGLVPCKLSKNDDWGFLDVKTGKFAIQPQFEFVPCGFVGDYAVVVNKKKHGIINSKGEYTVQPIYHELAELGNNVFAFTISDEEEKWGLMDGTGKILVPEIYSSVIITGAGYYSSESDWFVVINSSDKCGFVDKNGNEKLPFVYDWAYPFTEGYACVEQNGKYMVINKSGDIVFMLSDGEGLSEDGGLGFRNGLLLTQVRGNGDEQYRYRDTEGNIVYLW